MKKKNHPCSLVHLRELAGVHASGAAGLTAEAAAAQDGALLVLLGGGSGGGGLDRGGGSGGSAGGGGNSGGSRGDGGGGGRGRGRGGRAGAGAAGVQGRAGHLVAAQGAVGVEENARVVGGVELRGDDALGVLGAGAGDLDVEALRVVLSTVGGSGAVHGDDLVAEDVVARGQGGGHRRGPDVAVLDELRGRPLLGREVDARLVNLDPFERRLVGVGAVAVALGHVGQDGADVRLGPGAPLEVDGTAGRDRCRAGGRLGVLVTRDSVGAVLRGSHEPVVQVLGVPARRRGGRLPVELHVVVVEQEAAVLLAVGRERGHGAVGGGEAGQEAEHGGGLLHLGGRVVEKNGVSLFGRKKV